MQLITSQLADELPRNPKGKDPWVYAKLFDAFGSWTWYVLAYPMPKEGILTCYVEGFEDETGDVSLAELEELELGGGVKRIERDLHFVPKPLSEVQKEGRERRQA